MHVESQQPRKYTLGEFFKGSPPEKFPSKYF